MWPVQTLTLLLCLTDDEQLFARMEPVIPAPATIELKEEKPLEFDEKDLIWDSSC